MRFRIVLIVPYCTTPLWPSSAAEHIGTDFTGRLFIGIQKHSQKFQRIMEQRNLIVSSYTDGPHDPSCIERFLSWNFDN